MATSQAPQPRFCTPPSRGCSRVWVLRLQDAFLLQMNDFDRFLELELARMLDRVVSTPAPPRSSPPGGRPVVRPFTAPASSIAPLSQGGRPHGRTGRAAGGGSFPGAGFNVLARRSFPE